MEYNITAINDYLKGADITDIEDTAESLSIASVDLAYRALVDNCGGVAGEEEMRSAIYRLYQLSKVFKQLVTDNK